MRVEETLMQTLACQLVSWTPFRPLASHITNTFPLQDCSTSWRELLCRPRDDFETLTTELTIVRTSKIGRACKLRAHTTNDFHPNTRNLLSSRSNGEESRSTRFSPTRFPMPSNQRRGSIPPCWTRWKDRRDSYTAKTAVEKRCGSRWKSLSVSGMFK